MPTSSPADVDKVSNRIAIGCAIALLTFIAILYVPLPWALQAKYEINVYLDGVFDVPLGTPVTKSGITIGYVSEHTVLGNRTHVVLQISDSFSVSQEDILAVLSLNGVHVEQIALTRIAPLSEERRVRDQDVFSGQINPPGNEQ